MAIIKNDNTCKNCKYWALDIKIWCKHNNCEFTPSPNDVCNKLKEALEIDYDVNGDAYVYGITISTPKDFGCSLFKKDGELA